MASTVGVKVHNWDRTIVSHPRVVVRPRTVEDIVAIVKNNEKYPSPVRAVGSNHSTTHCAVAEGGTVVDMRRMNEIVEIGVDSVTVQAGALYIDVAHKLREHNLQFYFNAEIGNITIGSASTCGTKDSSMPGELGQANSYAIAIKMVTPAGELVEVTEDDPELLQVVRSSYGLLGIVYEATFRIRPLQWMEVYHRTFSIDELEEQLPELLAGDESMMMLVFPSRRSITIEFKKYSEPGEAPPNRYKWRFRNLTWGTLVPIFGGLVTRYVPEGSIRNMLLDGTYRITQAGVSTFMHGNNTLAPDQIIDYGAESGRARASFSIWAFPQERYIAILREYFDFCDDYFRTYGFRTDLPEAGYQVAEDQSSLLSYSHDGPVMTIDPVSTCGPGWEEFLQAYNIFSDERGGKPMFNQTKWLTHRQVTNAFGERLETFKRYRQEYDPGDRLLNDYFAEVLG